MAKERLRPLVPEALEIDEIGGTSWVGVVPFRMSDVMFRGLPALPGISAFPELNVRLYVLHEGRPGVWFLSLDATNPLAVWLARTFVYLPYRRARMTVRHVGAELEYSSAYGRARFEARYGPSSPPYAASPGSLEHWLTERYCLYAAAPDGSLRRCEVHHVPWPLQRARAHIHGNTLLSDHGVHVDADEPVLHFSRHIDVVFWPPRRVPSPPRTRPRGRVAGSTTARPELPALDSSLQE